MRRIRILGRSLALLALAAFLGAGSPEAAANSHESGARAVIKQVVERVLVVLRNDELVIAQKRAGIEKIAYAHFNFYIISRSVVARYWKRFDADQREEFQREFKQFLAVEYGKRLDDYEDQGVEVLGERAEARGDVTVSTRILNGDFDGANVDYRLRKKGDEWLIIDVVIEGVSLVSNWRDQFREILRAKDGPEKLLAQLRTKNATRAES